MEQFVFKAANESGGIETGTLEARSKAEAYNTLRARKLRPVSIEVGSGAPLQNADRGVKSADGSKIRALPAAQLLTFTEELSEMLDSGLQLEPALRVIESRRETSQLKPVASYLRQQVRDGVSFSNALRSCGKCFSELFCSMVAAGEAAGALPTILKRQAEYFAIMTDLRKRVAMALVYPSIVFSAGIVLMIIFMMFLLPQLTELLSKSQAKLPFMTRMMIGVSNFVGAWWWLMCVIVVLIGLGFEAWRRTPEGRFKWDCIQLRIPLVGAVLQGRFFAEFSQTLSTLVANGVTLLNGLSLLERATSNLYLRKILHRMADRVGEGSSLSSAMKAAGVFPALMIDMITVGEQTGDIAGALERSAKRFDREFSNRIAQITNLIQPITIMMVALFVGIVAYSMIMGILSSVSSLKPRLLNE